MSDPGGPNGDSKVVQTIDKWTRFASEDLARALDRRSFLKRAGTGAFFFLAALATGQSLSNPRQTSAASRPGPPPTVPNCAPPGPYCNYEGGSPPQPDACQGAHCFQHLSGGQIVQCHVYYAFYQSGCWTSSGSGGYWTCCDCQCTGGATCGCAQFSASPAPLPMGPRGRGVN